jgi:hypothetical protein
MIRQSEIVTMVEHHLAMNQQLANMDDSEDDRIAQIVHMMWSLDMQKDQMKYLESIKLVMSKMNSHSHVYQILNDNRMILELMPFLQIKYFWPHHTITHGLSIKHMSQWKPGERGVSPIDSRDVNICARYVVGSSW